MSKPLPLKRAALKSPDGKADELILFRREKGDYRWVFPKDGQEFDGVAYLSEEDAIRQLRVKVDGEPQFVGHDLTIYPIEPPPQVRAARKIYEMGLPVAPSAVESVIGLYADAIVSETNIEALLDAYQTLLAHCFQRRRIYAKAQFPVVEGQEPRDLVFDGLLLTCVEATEKATGQSLDNLKKILAEPTSRIVTARGEIKKGIVQ